MGMSKDDAWAWLIQYEPSLRKMIRRRCSDCKWLLEEAWDEVVDVVPRILEERWDPAEGGAYNYVRRYMQWHLHKFVQRRGSGRVGGRRDQLGNRVDTVELVDERSAHTVPLADSDQDLPDLVQYILEGLPTRERVVLEARYFGDMTYQEVADELGISKSSAVALGQRAMLLAQTLLEIDGHDGET